MKTGHEEKQGNRAKKKHNYLNYIYFTHKHILIKQYKFSNKTNFMRILKTIQYVFVATL